MLLASRVAARLNTASMAKEKLTGLAWGFMTSCIVVGLVLAYADRQEDALYAFLIGAVAGVVAIIATIASPARVHEAPAPPEEEPEEIARR
jgi:hypothetical protein